MITVTGSAPAQLVTVAVPGVQGPRGLPGPAGPQGESGDLSYVHNQATPSSTWTITHNLGKYPAVTIVDSANDQVGGEVNFPSVNQVIVSFSAAFSGRAFLS